MKDTNVMDNTYSIQYVLSKQQLHKTGTSCRNLSWGFGKTLKGNEVGSAQWPLQNPPKVLNEINYGNNTNCIL